MLVRRGSTAKHKGKAAPIFTFVDGKCEVTLTLDLKVSRTPCLLQGLTRGGL